MLYSGNSEIFSQLVLPVWRFQRNILINKLTFDLPQNLQEKPDVGIPNTKLNLTGKNARKKDED